MHTSTRAEHKLVFVSVILLLTIVACGAEEDVVKAPSPTPNVTIEILGSTHPEVREIRIEVIQQNNCGGTAEVESQIQKSKSIAHTIEVGAGLEVNANGQVGFAGTGVELGATVASQLGYSYGSVESISRSITLKAKEGTYMEHQVKLQEEWEIGTAKVVVSGREQEVPFSFRTDFSVELVDSKEIKGKCPSLPTPIKIPTPTNTPKPIEPEPPTPTNTLEPSPIPTPPKPADTPTPTMTPTYTPAPLPPTDTPTPVPLTDTPTPVTPTPTATPQPTGPITLTIYLRHSETDFVELSDDQVDEDIYMEGKCVYGEAAVQIGETTYHFKKLEEEVGPGEPQQLPVPWRVEFEFEEALEARTENKPKCAEKGAGFNSTKAQFWVGTLGDQSAVGEDDPYSLTMKLYEGNELRKSIQVFFTVADVPGPGGGGGPGGKPTPPE
jgi:hypothetical protein